MARRSNGPAVEALEWHARLARRPDRRGAWPDAGEACNLGLIAALATLVPVTAVAWQAGVGAAAGAALTALTAATAAVWWRHDRRRYVSPAAVSATRSAWRGGALRLPLRLTAGARSTGAATPRQRANRRTTARRPGR